MFPKPLVLALLLAGQDPPPEPIKPDSKTRFAIPYPFEKSITYQWNLQGTRCAETQFTLSRGKPDDSGEDSIEIQSTLDYARTGARLRLTGETRLGLDLRPRRYEGRKQLYSAGLQGQPTAVSAAFHGNLASVTLRTREQSEKSFTLADPTYLFESQAMEHWALLASVIAQRGEGSYSLFMPTDLRTLQMKFEREERVPDPSGREGSKSGESRTVWRWSGFHASMQVRLWITDDGVLLRYQQGDLNIHLVREKDVKKRSP